MATEQDIAKMMGVMAHYWPRFELTKDIILAYAWVLADLPADALDAGAKHCISTGGAFFPAVSEWREATVNVMIGRIGIPTVAAAWKEVQEEIEHGDHYGRWEWPPVYPTYSHPLIDETVAVLGYRHLSKQLNVSVDRAHFFRIFAELLDRAFAELMMLPEVKKISQDNQARLGVDVTSEIKLLAERMGK